jgi:isopentenyl diphosphate isomerase/L-lactate dehydrogenase-like FMN-dependent dehydrogenase
MDGPKVGYMRQIYLEANQAGMLPQTTKYAELRSLAQKAISPEAYGYAEGSASTEKTAQNNVQAFDHWQIVPRMLADVDVTDVDMKTELFGVQHPTPLVISPIGVQALYHKDADSATAQAAVAQSIPYTHSSAASTPIEVVSEEAELKEESSNAWFQLYWPSDDKLTESLLKRAKAAGFTVLVVTLDTFVLGWRPGDLDQGFNPFLKGGGVANIFSDPYFIETYCDGQDPRAKDASQEQVFEASVAAVNLLNPGISRKWSELKLLRELWGEGPIVLKGIQSLLDANRAVEAGMDGIWVSNHGGRQVDGAMGSLQALAAIGRYVRSLPMYSSPGIITQRAKNATPADMQAVGTEGDEDRALSRRRRPYVIFDSGVRCGADIMKALALGADGVAIGRPWLWGLAVGGQEGVEKVLRTLAADLELNMTLSGIQATSQLNPNILVRAGQEPRL